MRLCAKIRLQQSWMLWLSAFAASRTCRGNRRRGATTSSALDECRWSEFHRGRRSIVSGLASTWTKISLLYANHGLVDRAAFSLERFDRSFFIIFYAARTHYFPFSAGSRAQTALRLSIGNIQKSRIHCRPSRFGHITLSQLSLVGSIR